MIGTVADILREEECAHLPQTSTERQRFWTKLLEEARVGVFNIVKREKPKEMMIYEQSFWQKHSADHKSASEASHKQEQVDSAVSHTAPSMQEHWAQSLLSDPEQILNTLTIKVEGERLVNFISQVKFITFFENVHSMLSSSLSNSQDSSHSSLFWSTMIFDNNSLSRYDVREQVKTLLGHYDSTLIEEYRVGYNMRTTAAKVLNIDEEKAVSSLRCWATTNYTVDVQKVLGQTTYRTLDTVVFKCHNGLSGIALPETKPGDRVATIFRRTAFEVPFILRPEEEGKHSMVCPTRVSGNFLDKISMQTRMLVIV